MQMNTNPRHHIHLLAGILLLATTSIIVTASLAPTSPTQHCRKYRGACQAQWQQLLPRSARTRSIKHLIFPGTHDSGSVVGSITIDKVKMTPNQFDPNAWYFYLARALTLDPSLEPIMLPFLANISETQGLTVGEQLEQGNRVVDLRLTYVLNKTHPDDTLWLSHTFLTQRFKPVIREIREFLERTEEVVIVRLTEDFEHQNLTREHAHEFINFVYSELREFIGAGDCNRWQTLDNISLDHLVSTKQRALIVFSDYFYPNITTLFPWLCHHGLVGYDWLNHETIPKVIEQLASYVHNTPFERQLNSLGGVAAVLTPETDDIVKIIFEFFLNKNHSYKALKWWAEEMRGPTEKILDNFFVTQKRYGLSVMCVDWPTDAFVAKVIGYNLL